MNTLPCRLLSVLVVCGFVLLGSTVGFAADDGTAAVKAATEAYVAAFNEGHADRFGKFWAEDADYTTSDGEHFRGRKTIQELMAADSEGLAGTKLKISDAIIRMLKPDVALQDGILEFTAPDGLADRSRYTAVWMKGTDGWQLASVRDLGPLPTVAVPQVRENPLAQLEALRGEWQTEDDVAKVHLTADWKLSKQFLEFDYDVTPKEGEPYKVLQVIGWDPVDEVVRSWFFDSTGGHGSGVWEKTDTGWTVLSSGVTPTGQLGGGLYEYVVSAKTLTLNITNREVAGQPLPDAEVKFARK